MKRNAPNRSQGREEKMQGAFLFRHLTRIVNHWHRALNRRQRVRNLRKLQQHYSRAVDRTFDRQASWALDCVRFLLDAEGEDSGGEL